MITAQICNRQLVVLQTLYNICQISTILDTRTINHDVQFSSTYKFDGAIFLGSTKINQFKYVGNIVMNSNMNMFAFMIIIQLLIYQMLDLRLVLYYSIREGQFLIIALYALILLELGLVAYLLV
ncbi:Hypothetical_protein [Hexamita inflata]|uniref:Hypothetical_protein n=1 Tax=Hexamita inflata TaxID=28002 RepID=A0ABP1IK74_9EUKA